MRPTWPEVSTAVSPTRYAGGYLPARVEVSRLLIPNNICNAGLIAPWNQYHHGQGEPGEGVDRQHPHKDAQSSVLHTTKLLGLAFTDGVEAALFFCQVKILHRSGRLYFFLVKRWLK